MPSGLLESELFGHERGAFTGAIAQKLGRFELAHQGTLFLDEIGDIPLELQPKLLRVLAGAGVRALGQHAHPARRRAPGGGDQPGAGADGGRAGHFRADLYYRLMSFPLRSRRCANGRRIFPCWCATSCATMRGSLRKRIDTIPAEALDALTHYHWPGNVRELQNVIERAVILSPGPALRLALDELPRSRPATGSPARVRTLEEVEREHILRVLRETNGVIGGPQGAAARLGLRRTTLLYRMEKLGISRQPA